MTLKLDQINAIIGNGRRNRVLTDEVKEMIHEMVAEGKKVGEIAKEVGVPYQYVFNYLTRIRAKLQKEQKQ